MSREIFKLQRSLFASDDTSQILVYNEDKTVMYQVNQNTRHGQYLSKYFKEGEYKVYVWASAEHGANIVVHWRCEKECYW